MCPPRVEAPLRVRGPDHPIDVSVAGSGGRRLVSTPPHLRVGSGRSQRELPSSKKVSLPGQAPSSLRIQVLIRYSRRALSPVGASDSDKALPGLKRIDSEKWRARRD